MAPPLLKKRKVENGMNGRTSRPKKKIKLQREYHSSSEDDNNNESFTAVNLQDSESNNEARLAKKAQRQKVAEKSDLDGSDADADSNSDSYTAASYAASDSDIDSDASISGSDQTKPTQRKKFSKRNDPTAFSTSISKILSTKLPRAARADPLLSRSRATLQTTSDLANEKLESRARAKLRAEKKEELERGRIRDVLGVETGDAGEMAEQEKRLRKIAQRGVVKLFNAVREAQVRGEELAREERRKRGIVGMAEREKAVNEVCKQGFLDLINGKGGKSLNIEEA
ncbi:rRNA processing protein RRP15 [Paracoccidioides lutzii Pb01]|uniref:Ribosomal RNA-processing protein 15 n=1 Tax=Paracoccidioides lutzii (strain ATCC MYA-826 / Pb01) TaxID=502779 RepID=C1H0G6_PARBA|nr:rRNA processing protein RRP15 [Paracoccidioides lutzii Pb01]EEH33207.1 hypothetical protein PAAG_04260 [Paracoccidioides lutzii Pb01]